MSRVGDVFLSNRVFLNNKVNDIGICYEDYNSGISVLFESGFYDGFNNREIKTFMRHVGHSVELEKYKFRSVLNLNADYADDFFSIVLRDRKFEELFNKDPKTFFYDTSFEDY